jgi:hypothetical protein
MYLFIYNIYLPEPQGAKLFLLLELKLKKMCNFFSFAPYIALRKESEPELLNFVCPDPEPHLNDVAPQH